MNVKELFLIQKAHEHQGTIAVYSKIPHDRLDWRPAEGLVFAGTARAARVHVGRGKLARIALDGNWSYYEKRVPLGLFFQPR